MAKFEDVRVLDVVLPTDDEVLRDLQAVRRAGIAQIARLDTPALERLARASGRVGVDEPVGGYVIESMIREAAVQAGGDLADAAALALGLEDGARADRPPELRKLAAELVGVSVSHFRHAIEPRILMSISQVMLRDAYDYRLRLMRLREEARAPIATRLAVEWLARFEAMYEVWTPMTGLGSDLTAYRSTLLEIDRPWDRKPDPNDPTDKGHTQERQALGYAYDALYHFARVQTATRRFIRGFGGMWLLPEPQAETDIGDALYRVTLESPFAEREDSQLRGLISRSDQEELDPFLTLLEESETGRALRDLWERWCDSCRCDWDQGVEMGRDFFPTHRNMPSIDRTCDVHNLILGCNDFCLILDDAWDQIADWYRDFPRPARTGMTAEGLYVRRESPLPKHMRTAE